MALLCCYAELPDEINLEGKNTKFSSVYTFPASRGRGYMEHLLCYLLDEAKRYGIREIYVKWNYFFVPPRKQFLGGFLCGWRCWPDHGATRIDKNRFIIIG